MISLGLIGFPLAHSLSPALHKAAFTALGMDGEYRLYPVAPGDMNGLAQLTKGIREGELQGLNVTIPHKQSILPLLDTLTPSANAIGAINTISFMDNKLIGHNTDAPGFLADLYGAVPHGFAEKKAIVLGAGGAARAVVYALLTDGWTVVLAVRKADLEQAAHLIAAMDRIDQKGATRFTLLDVDGLSSQLGGIRLIVNATPLGMFPDVGDCPWPEVLDFPQGAVVYDLVYNPRATMFIRRARAAGLRTASGIGMLVEQAALSFEIWTGRVPPRGFMVAQVEEK